MRSSKLWQDECITYSQNARVYADIYIYFSSSMFVYFTHMPLLCVYIYVYIYKYLCILPMGRNLVQFAQVARAFIASVKTIWLDACVKSSKSEKVEHLVQKGFKTRTSWADTQVLFIQARLCRGLNNIYIYVCVQRVGSCYILCRIYIYITYCGWTKCCTIVIAIQYIGGYPKAF